MLDGVNWTDITSDVIKPIPFSYGIFGGGPTDRTANTGTMSFELRNDAGNSAGLAGYYTPGHINCRAGFTNGLKIRQRITYDGTTKTKWAGRIPANGIRVDSGNYGTRRVGVECRDFMEQAGIHELQSPAFAQNKTIMEVVALLLANMTITPAATDYRTGSETFGSVFDTVRSTTRAVSEFDKVAQSEMGFIYPRHDLANDEVLRVEGRYTRNDEVPSPTGIPTSSSQSDFLIGEDDAFLMGEDGSYLVGSSVMTLSFSNAQTGMSVTGGSYFYNRVKVTTYPRKVDASVVTLATVQTPFAISAGETKAITLRYRDPNGATMNVSGIDMVTPAATTDYLCNTASDGSGSNLTASTTVVATFGTGDVTLAFTNSSASDGYILAGSKVRGKGVYLYDPIGVTAEDTASIEDVGPHILTVDMKYQDNPDAAYGFAAFLLTLYQTPRLVVESVSFIANRNDTTMGAFFYLEPGDRLQIAEDMTGTRGEFFIQGVEGEILQGDIIRFTWFLRDAGYDMFSFANWDSVEVAELWDAGAWAF
jgi:hypothetical protein